MKTIREVLEDFYLWTADTKDYYPSLDQAEAEIKTLVDEEKHLSRLNNDELCHLKIIVKNLQAFIDKFCNGG